MSALLKTIDDFSTLPDSAYYQAPTYIEDLKKPSINNDLFLSNNLNLVNFTNYGLLDFSRTAPIPKTESAPQRGFKLLQEWFGTVTEINSNTFTAVISDRTNPENTDELVVLDLSEVPEDDVKILRLGSLFYWSVGYEDSPGIPRQRVSRIRLQRLPGLTVREILKAEKKALSFKDIFN
jgi:hypothetical protein